MGEFLDFNETKLGRLAIVVNELGNNLHRYAKNGRMILTLSGLNPDGIDILALDDGPGLNVDQVMQDGFTTGVTPGTGMGAVLRQSDEFDIYSQEGKGTVVLSRILMKTGAPRFFDIAGISLPLKGETVSGDGWAAYQDENTLEILAVDGLGHGPHAAEAAEQAVLAFSASISKAIDQVVQSIHSRLKSTRGAAVFLLHARGKVLSFGGVGNIRAFWQSQSKVKNLISQNGTAGIQIRASRTFTEEWDESGYLILHSDGILSRYNLLDYPGLLHRHPAIVAAIILRDYSRGNDDAMVLVARKSK
jgi:anti-sigma regulatory factor (Ser/Thr protein kinase)